MMKKKYLLYITASFFIVGTASALQRSCEEAYDDTSSVYKRTCHPLCLSDSCQTQLANCTTEECKAQYLCWELGYASGSCNSNEKYLICPFSDSWKACSLSSCGGYGLRILKSGTKYYLSNNDDLSQADFTQEISAGNLASAAVVNGKLNVTTSFGTLEACDKNHDSLGATAEQVLKKMWKYTECSETSMFENGQCIEACNQTVCQNENGNIMCYPYSSLSEMSIRKGEIGECQDNLGTHYGYTKCNDGFEKNASGDCVLATCSLTEYLYSAGNKPDETRGDVMTCYIGGGKRYGYKNCKEGYLFFKYDNNVRYGMCNKKVDIEAASKSGENKVQLGDYLTKDGKEVAVVYDTTNGDGKVRALSIHAQTSMPWSISSGVTIDTNTSSCIIPWSADTSTQDLYGKMKTSGSSVLTTDPSYTGYSKCLTGSTDAMGNYWVTYDYNGRYNTQQIVAFNAKKNTSSGANAGRNYPYCAAVFVNSYPNDPNVFATEDYIWNGTVNCNASGKDINGNTCTKPTWSSVCGNGTTISPLHGYRCSTGRCAPGQWYLPAEGELGYIYDNRQALQTSLVGIGKTYNDNKHGLGLTSYYWSSTETYANVAWYLLFSTGYRGYPAKYNYYYVRPVLAF